MSFGKLDLSDLVEKAKKLNEELRRDEDELRAREEDLQLMEAGLQVFPDKKEFVAERRRAHQAKCLELGCERQIVDAFFMLHNQGECCENR